MSFKGADSSISEVSSFVDAALQSGAMMTVDAITLPRWQSRILTCSFAMPAVLATVFAKDWASPGCHASKSRSRFSVIIRRLSMACSTEKADAAIAEAALSALRLLSSSWSFWLDARA